MFNDGAYSSRAVEMETALARFHRKFDATLYTGAAQMIEIEIRKKLGSDFINPVEMERAVKVVLMKVDEAALWTCGLGYLYNPLETVLSEFATSGFSANATIAVMAYLREFEGFEAIDDINNPQPFDHNGMENEKPPLRSAIDDFMDSLLNADSPSIDHDNPNSDIWSDDNDN